MSSKQPKRQYRRNRWRIKQHLRFLDGESLRRIRASYIASMDTWGGVRCPDCGIQTRPYKLFYPGEGRIIENGKTTGFITMGVFPPCSNGKVKGCKGEVPYWEIKASYKAEKRYLSKVKLCQI